MIRLSTRDASFTRDFAALVDARRESDADVTRDVSNILRSVREEGVAALRAFTQKLDGHDLDDGGWSIPLADC
ncbi:MAG: histidinol dehydrogenase, partial [Sphingomonas sp.]